MRDQNSKMPKEIGDIYDGLDRELSWYQRTLTALYDLYVDKSANVEIFNALAPDFFGFLQRTLVDSLIVLLGRLTDAESNRSQENLSFKRLVAEVDNSQHAPLRDEVHIHLAKIELHSQSARKHRNKRVAHSDLDIALSSSTLPDIVIVDFKEVLKACRDLLNAVASYFDGFEVSHTVAPAPGGTHSLLLALQRAFESKSQDSFKYYMGFNRNTVNT